MTAQKVTIGLIQTKVSDDAKVNLDKTVERIREAAKKGAQVICLQELYRAKYFPQHEKRDATRFAETIPGESTETLSKLAEELGVVLVVPVFEKDPSGKYYNSAAVIDADGRIMGKYRKMHIPHDPFFYEKDYFEAGNMGYRVFKTRYLSLAVLICYDQWFPEAARISTLKGADILFYPTAIGYPDENQEKEDWYDAWEVVQRSHAIANGVHVAAVNRVGNEEKLSFWGASFVCDAFGKVLKRASKDKEEVLVVEIDTSQNKSIRDSWGFFNNRRPETYGPIVSHDTPAHLGYGMPAEWERHSATWLSWPHDQETFPNGVEKVEKTYLEIISALQKSEDVNLFVKDNDTKARVAKLLNESSIDPKRVSLHIGDYTGTWMRDYGPIFLVNKSSKKLAMTHWIFDAWGGKYANHMKDTHIPDVINQELRLDCFKPGIILEGGSIDVNGSGTLMTTEQCLLNKNRNPNLSKKDIEGYLMDYLGVRNIIWIKGGVAGDDTDGHVDDIARFVGPKTVLCAYEEDEKDENHSILKENYEMLVKAKDQDGNKLKVIRLPMPPRTENKFSEDEGERLPASYLNFYIGNDVVLVPVFGHENDKVALKAIQEAFPSRKIVGINCSDLIYGLGAIHCITQQQPAVK
jgi:agmatine deiminase